MADDPIRLGTAALSTLVAESGSHITTDDFGVQHGTVRHWLGDQSLAQSSRFTLGASYSGTLPQFTGFKVEKSGDITGIDGKCANLDVEYARSDPLWQTITRQSRQLQLIRTRLGDSTGSSLVDDLTSLDIPVPKRTISLRFSASSAPGQLGQYSTPSGAPTVPVFTAKPFQTLMGGTFGLQKIDTEVSYAIGRGSNGCCTGTLINNSIVQLAGSATVQLINTIAINFSPDPLGWLCVKEDVTPLCGAQIFQVEQEWIREMYFSGFIPGETSLEFGCVICA